MKIHLIIPVILLLVIRTESIRNPNIVLVLTDDQDLALNSISFLNKINKLLINKGTVFLNAVSCHNSVFMKLSYQINIISFSLHHHQSVVHLGHLY
jgi:hypothetical protein